MQWTLVHSSLTNVSPGQDNDVILDVNKTGKYIIIFCDSLGKNPTWKSAGYLYSEWDDAAIGRIRDKSWYCRFGHTSITLNDWQFLNPLVFVPRPYLINIQLKVWSTPDMALYDQLSRVEEDVKELIEIIGG